MENKKKTWEWGFGCGREIGICGVMKRGTKEGEEEGWGNVVGIFLAGEVFFIHGTICFCVTSRSDEYNRRQ